MVARDITERLRAEEVCGAAKPIWPKRRGFENGQLGLQPNTKIHLLVGGAVPNFWIRPHEPPLNYERVAQRMHPDDLQRTLHGQKAMRDGRGRLQDNTAL